MSAGDLGNLLSDTGQLQDQGNIPHVRIGYRARLSQNREPDTTDSFEAQGVFPEGIDDTTKSLICQHRDQSIANEICYLWICVCAFD